MAMKSRTQILRLVRPRVNQDALEAADKLVHDIKRGATVGVAFIAMHKVNKYTVTVAGECRRYRAAARGMVQELSDQLSASKWK